MRPYRWIYIGRYYIIYNIFWGDGFVMSGDMIIFAKK